MDTTVQKNRFQLWLKYNLIETLISLIFVLGLIVSLMLIFSTIHHIFFGNSHLFELCRTNPYLFLSPALILSGLSPKVRYGPMMDIFNVITPSVIDKQWKQTIGLLDWRFYPIQNNVKLIKTFREIKKDLVDLKDLMS